MIRQFLKGMGISILLIGGYLAAGQAQAAIAVYGQLGYQIVEFEQDNDGGGLEMAGYLHYDMDRLAGGPIPFVEGGLRYGQAEATDDGVTLKLSTFSLGANAGVQFALAQKMTLQAVLGYEFGMSGDFTVEQSGTSKEYDVDGYRRLNHEWRTLFNVYPTTRLGFGLGWFTGHFKPNDFSNDVDFTGYAFRALIDSRF